MRDSSSNERPPREVESTLLLRTEEPGPLRERLAGLDRAGRFELRPRPPQRIRDAYLDTPGRDLGARRIALRLRDLDGSFLVAMKADSVVTDFAADRVEIEGEWSEEVLRRILRELRGRGISGLEALPGGNLGDPFEGLRSLGFVTLQDRETVRLPRDVSEGPGGPVAEMAIDEVLYHLEAVDLRMHEVEVEARGSGDADTVREVAEALRSGSPELRPWSHGKLATGFGLQALLRAGRLDGLVRADGTLTLPGFELLAAWCEAEAS